MHLIGITEIEERERGKEIFEDIMAKDFSKLITDSKPEIQEAQKHQSREIQKKQKNLHLGISYSNYGKTKQRE